MAGDGVLRQGATGASVRRLQRALAAAGLDVVVDGRLGKRTVAAVKAFQRSMGLDPDGKVGPRTWSALSEFSPNVTRRSLSDAGVAFVAGFEGFRGELYDDAAGHCTIGFGHLVHHGPRDGTEPAEFRRGISRERGLELLRADARQAAAAVERLVRVPLSQEQFDALVSFAFNVGTGALEGSTLLQELNAGRYDAVPTQLLRWVKAGGRTLEGLVRRRRAEGRLFGQGAYR